LCWSARDEEKEKGVNDDDGGERQEKTKWSHYDYDGIDEMEKLIVVSTRR
jgi:hypothetical protein